MLHINLNDPKITKSEKKEIEKLILMQNPDITNDLEQIWYLMDKIWDDMGCDNKNLDWEKIGKYYSHPVWLLNGLFIENHELSMQIRENIADYIAQKNFKYICDYGGGFGTLARSIAKKCPNSIIHIYEPHPSHYGIECIKDYKNIVYTDIIQENFYDCIVSTDVLEHIEFPLETFYKIINSTRFDKDIGGGDLIIANCFHPYIKCHLPHNFHLRYTFDYFAEQMGLKKIGQIPGTHATIFRKITQLQHFKIRAYQSFFSKALFYSIETSRPIRKFLANIFNKH